jgi:hypothetical protein
LRRRGSPLPSSSADNPISGSERGAARAPRDPARATDAARLTPWLFYAATAILLLTAALYGPAIGSYFHSDDFVLIEQVRRGGPFSLWTHAPSGFLRPVVSLSLATDLALWGLQPAGYHCFNVAVHALNALLVGALALRILPPARRAGLAFAAAVLFVVQPFHAESVCWVSGRTDLLATFFFLGSFYAYIRWRETAYRRWLIASVAACLLALGSKESSAILPMIMLVWEFAGVSERSPYKIGLVWLCAPTAVFFGIVIGFVVVRRLLLGALIAGYGSASYLSFAPRHLFEAALWYASASQLPLFPRARLYLLALAAETALVIWRRRTDRRPPPAAAGFLLLAWGLSILPAFTLAGGVADGMTGRLAYLPSVFALMALVVLADYVCGAARATAAALAALAVIFAIQLSGLCRVWYAAGEIGRRAVTAASSLPPTGRCYVLAAPDCRYPAYILRNGLPEALALTGSATRRVQIHVVSSAFLYAAGDTVSVYPAGQGRYDIRVRRFRPLADPKALSFTVNAGIEWSVETIGMDEIEVALRGLEPGDSVWYIDSEGRLIRVPGA